MEKRYVNRDKLIEYANNQKNKCIDANDIARFPLEYIEEVKHGVWIYDHWCEFKCSNCGNLSNSKPYKGRENYCPNCGAKMLK